MDPNKNFRERIALAEAGERRGERFAELTKAYAEWIMAGGFPADASLRFRLVALMIEEE